MGGFKQGATWSMFSKLRKKKGWRGKVRNGNGRQLLGNWDSPGTRGVGQVITGETEGREEKQLEKTAPLWR